jgi:transcription elongation factor GreA
MGWDVQIAEMHIWPDVRPGLTGRSSMDSVPTPPCGIKEVGMSQVSDTLPLTPEAYRKLEFDLESVRAERRDYVDRLRVAREFGEPGANDELMAIREDQAIIDARLARLEQILGRAEVVEPAALGDAVAIGSTVTVLDHNSGRTTSYRIDGAHGALDSDVISALSPMGTALIGSPRGAVVRVELPRGRSRTLTILDVAHREDL